MKKASLQPKAPKGPWFYRGALPGGPDPWHVWSRPANPWGVTAVFIARLPGPAPRPNRAMIHWSSRLQRFWISPASAALGRPLRERIAEFLFG